PAIVPLCRTNLAGANTLSRPHRGQGSRLQSLWGARLRTDLHHPCEGERLACEPLALPLSTQPSIQTCSAEGPSRAAPPTSPAISPCRASRSRAARWPADRGRDAGHPTAAGLLRPARA